MDTHTVIAHRAITNHLCKECRAFLCMTKELLLSVSSGKQKYYAYMCLDEERNKEKGGKKLKTKGSLR